MWDVSVMELFIYHIKESDVSVVFMAIIKKKKVNWIYYLYMVSK